MCSRFVSAVAISALALSPLRMHAQGADSLLVSTSWLASHLSDPNVVIIHAASTRRDYLNGHVPGARFLWTGTYAPSTPDLSTELPNVAVVDSALEAMGVTDKSRIIIYGAVMTPMVARLALTLEWLGAGDRTSILDGGLAAWKAAGQTTSTEVPTVAKGKFTPHPRAVTVDADFVKTNLAASGVKILDARDRQFYDGNGGGMPRPGHIPSAANVPFMTVLTETGTFKSRDALREMFTAAGVQPGEKIVTYCHVGQQASQLWFAARLAGFDAKLYDGSFEDWSGRTELPVDGPVKK